MHKTDRIAAKRLRLPSSVLVAVLLAGGSSSMAQTGLSCGSLFGALLNSPVQSVQVCSTSLQGLYEAGIRDVGASLSSYAGDEAITTVARLNGLAATASFAQASANLEFSIPELNILQTFAGGTRVASARLMHDWLNNNADLRGRMLQHQAAHSAVNPVTGPGGVLSGAVGLDFGASFDEVATRIATTQANAQSGVGNLIGIGVLVSQHDIAGATVRTVSAPLSYTVRNDIDPRRQALLRASLGVVDSAGTKSRSGRVSAGYRFPMSDEWALTPMVGVSLSGSDAHGFYTGVASGSIASTYLIERDGFDISVGNMLGYYRSFKPPGVSYGVDPGLQVFALRNGILISQPITLGSRKMSVEYGLSDTRYLGDALYQKSAQDISISLGTNKSVFSARSFFRATLALQKVRDGHGVALNVNYWF
ncbi:MAG: autotransporter outer membrane beta-barrel domain-containing protein [Rhodoferax sp.]|nr:autotransporter outer membrane beta-barrel domain-containing protein [Rhodoferax sp.]